MLAPNVIPVFHLPDGPKNLSALMPLVNFNEISEYYVELQDADGNVILRTNWLTLGCCCASDKVRIHFRNSLGAMDAVNFNPPRIIREISSKEYRTPQHYPLAKEDATIERFNVNSTNTWECVTTCYREEDQPWLMELAGASKAFLEWSGIEGQEDGYVPIRILDGKFDERKNVDEFIYPFRISFKVANDLITHRN